MEKKSLGVHCTRNRGEIVWTSIALPSSWPPSLSLPLSLTPTPSVSLAASVLCHDQWSVIFVWSIARLRALSLSSWETHVFALFFFILFLPLAVWTDLCSRLYTYIHIFSSWSLELWSLSAAVCTVYTISSHLINLLAHIHIYAFDLFGNARLGSHADRSVAMQFYYGYCVDKSVGQVLF